MKFLKPLLVMAIIILSLILILYPDSSILLLGMAIAFLAVFIYASFSRDEGVRARWIFVAIFILLAGVIGWVFHIWLAANAQPDGYWGETGLRVVSLVVGVFISFFVTLIFMAITVYVSSIYVLSLQIAEEISWWDAYRSLLSLIFNTQYDWIVVTDGEISKVKGKGVMAWLGGPGKIVIDPGSAVILQRGGKVTRIVGAGIYLTKRHEHIRMAFDLRNQFVVTTEENVITADRIPLTVELGRGYRIAPAEKPYSPTVITDNRSRFPVEEETLLRAAFENTSGKWSGLGAGAPAAQLLDQMMSYKLDELFEFEPGKEPSPSTRMIKKIEGDIMAALNGFAASKGLEFTMVDIRKITMPEAVRNTQAMAIAEKQRNEITKELFSVILDSVREGEVDAAEIDRITSFIEELRRLEIMREMAKSNGTKIINTSNTPVEYPIEAK